MNAKLVFLDDSGIDREDFVLEQHQSMIIGRAENCSLILSGAGVSRQHCRLITTEGGDFEIEDLGSHNGTLVNNYRVERAVLRHGDRIEIGAVRMLFMTDVTEEAENIFSNEVRFIEDAGSTTEEFSIAAIELPSKLPSEISILTEIGRALNEIKSSDKLQESLTAIILEVIPAERAAIMLLGNDLESARQVTVLDKKHRLNGNDPMPISRKISQHVLDYKKPVISNNLSQSDFRGTESLILYGINSVLCVPLILGEITGLIYLDSSDPTFRFKENHLQQITAVANLAASALKNARHIEMLEAENQSLQNSARIETDLIGDSAAMQNLLNMIAKAAPSDSTVLISGETGTGKELVARSVHRNSIRRNKPYIVINCALLTENLLESELFGHEKGAFTGAALQKKGKLEIAEGGTVFLDEIGELSLPLQVKLLRFLQEREFERLGGNRVMKADVRIIAATNRDLKEEVNRGNFREDLYFRLKVVELKTTPLKDRTEDIQPLIEHFIEKYSRQCRRRVEGISRKAMSAMRKYEWRGNVRELENAIERALVMGSDSIIQLEDLPYELSERRLSDKSTGQDYQTLVREAKRGIILEAIRGANKNYSEAARRLKIHPNNLHRIMRELGMKETSKSN